MPTNVFESWKRLAAKRVEFLERARDYSSLTVPSLYPPEGYNDTTELPTPFQSTGARGVNNLTSKLMLTLFPPHAPFFSLEPSQAAIDAVVAAGGDGTNLDEVRIDYAEVERRALQRFDVSGARAPLFEALQQLIVSGNTLFDWFDPDHPRTISLENHVVDRDALGVVREIIIRERIRVVDVPEAERSLCALSEGDRSSQETDLWSWVRLEPSKRYSFEQFVATNAVPLVGSRREFKPDALPFLPVALRRQARESYGRGYVELYFGSLISLEALSQALVEGAVAAARVLWMIDPNSASGLRPKDLAEKRNGAYTVGRAEDVKALQLDKFSDFQTAASVRGQLTAEIEYGFLVNRSIQRQAERVTAEEIRFMAQDLEEALGGVYGDLSTTLQRPLIQLALRQVDVPSLGGVAVLKVVSGSEGLGRGQELQRIRGFISDLVSLSSEAQTAIDPIGLAQALQYGWGVSKSHKLVRSAAELQQIVAQQRFAEAASKAAPSLVNAISKTNAPQGGG